VNRFIVSFMISTGIAFGLIGKVFAINENEVTTKGTSFTDVAILEAKVNKASRLGISLDDYEKYLAIMESHRKFWTPNLHPINVLGSHANTDAERRRYAKMLARLEYERLKKELAFEAVYQEEFKKLYPGNIVEGKKAFEKVYDEELKKPGGFLELLKNELLVSPSSNLGR